jgi:DinB family protein
MGSLARPEPSEYAPFYEGYIRLVPEGPVRETLRVQFATTLELLGGIPEDRALHRYAPGKWSIKEVVGHIADAERVFAYRALCIARGDPTPLPGFDENAYVASAQWDARPLPALLEDLRTLREANVRLFDAFDPAALIRRGTVNNAPASVRAILHIIAGHERHHVKILSERYL